MIQLFFAAKWILISEVTFESGKLQLFSSQDIFAKVPSPSSQTGHWKKALQRNLHRSVSRKVMPLVPGRWNEKRMMRNVWQCLLCSYSRAGSNNTDMRIKGSPPTLPSPSTVQCPSKVSPTQRVKLLSDKTEAFVQKIESHKRRLPSSTQCRPLRNLGIQNI